MSVPRNVRPARLLNTRYFRRIAERKQLHQARRVVKLVNTSRPKIIAVVVGLAGALVAAGAGGAMLVHGWIR